MRSHLELALLALAIAACSADPTVLDAAGEGEASPHAEPALAPLQAVTETVRDPLLWDVLVDLPPGGQTRRLTELLRDVEAHARAGEMMATSSALAEAEEILTGRYLGNSPLFPDAALLFVRYMREQVEPALPST